MFIDLSRMLMWFRKSISPARKLMIPVFFPQLCCSETGWSDLLVSQHFSRTSAPQDGMAHSTFTYHQATIVCSLCFINNFTVYLLLNNFIYYFKCMGVCLHGCLDTCMPGAQSLGEGVGFLELELQTAVHCYWYFSHLYLG